MVTSLEWTQELNPLSVTGQDMNPTDMVWSSGNPCWSFKGLSLTTRTETLLDGKVGNDWYYSVGNSKEWKGGNPAVDCGNGYPTTADRTSLYVATDVGGGKGLYEKILKDEIS